MQLPPREGRDSPDEVRGTHFSVFTPPPEIRRPSGPKEEDVRLPPPASMVPSFLSDEIVAAAVGSVCY